MVRNLMKILDDCKCAVIIQTLSPFSLIIGVVRQNFVLRFHLSRRTVKNKIRRRVERLYKMECKIYSQSDHDGRYHRETVTFDKIVENWILNSPRCLAAMAFMPKSQVQREN